METEGKSQPFHVRRAYLFYLVLAVSLLIVFVIFAEVGSRLLGERPWTIKEVDITVEPGGSFFTKHPSLGYALLPGKFKVILKDSYSFDVTHLDDALRVTRPEESQTSKDEIWIFGGSITHGWTLNDEETFPWLIQSELPDYAVVNFGVPGYGTLHSLIQFKEALEQRRKPVIAVIAYASFHDRRNTFLRVRRKSVARYNKLGPQLQPYARLDDDGNLISSMAEVEYQEWPLMRYSAFVHVIEKLYNNLEDNFYRSHEVTKAIVKEFSRLAERNGVKLVVANITSNSATAAMLDFARGERILTADMWVDLDIEGNRNLPHDSHPSAVANRQYALKLMEFLRTIM